MGKPDASFLSGDYVDHSFLEFYVILSRRSVRCFEESECSSYHNGMIGQFWALASLF